MVIPIFYAHPETKGHNLLILNEVIKNLRAKKISYRVIDLYREKYNPVLSNKELYTFGDRFLAEDTKKYQKIINNCSTMIFIYPIWWNAMPAILKGFFDRTLTSPFAFQYKAGIPVKHLEGRRALVFQTMGSPRWYQIVTGNRPKKTIALDILKFVGIKAKVVQFNNIKGPVEKNQERIKRVVGRVLRGL